MLWGMVFVTPPPLSLKVCAVAPYVSPFAALAIHLGGYDNIGSSKPATLAAVVLYFAGLVAPVVALARTNEVRSRWRTVAGLGVVFSLVGFPLLCVGLIYVAIAGAGMPGH